MIKSKKFPNEDQMSFMAVIFTTMTVGVIFSLAKIFLQVQTFVHMVIIVGLAARGLIVPFILLRNNENLKDFMRTSFKSVSKLPK